MKLSERAKHHPVVTAEVIPDRVVPAHLPLLEGRVDAITIPALRNGENDPSYPAEFRVTPQTRSLASATIVKKTGFEAVPSLTCRDFRKSDLKLLPQLFEKGLENFLVVFGDPYPNYSVGTYDFKKAEELIREIRSVFHGPRPCIGAVTNQYALDREQEISRTQSKVDAGADYLITNSAFDDYFVLEYIDALRARGLKVPIFVQLSIPRGLNNLLFVGRRFGIPIPEKAKETVSRNPLGGGVEAIARAYAGLQKEVNGIHFSYLFRSHNPIPTYTHLLDAIETDGQLVISLRATLRA
ncbi:MAG TPA: methylenetetrahydrofolate reductase [Candidatus Bathyarchaeia archaeon]|nr:methylenetetrahydrofolate reductase [Candidatus Bathyarchaeia archaeon]